MTWDEFTTNFRSHHKPSGVMKTKKEFLSLKQEGMSVAKYRDMFIELSRYATKEVAEDRKKQELFLDGLASSLQYQLMSYPFPTFQQLVDAAIRLEQKIKERGE
jgi:predicted DNA binding CopG/RHH family protein